ncbi:MAG: ribbon-helix-helix domain-containing protein [Candidatus Omnitrophica bacterium]|jgi:Arc/MetJ-type ribon-helix-helix transcriptional regulator|nr:ribbon-helix-helix domain-containing protein [Candidatus Omnitrophota bacterium]
MPSEWKPISISLPESLIKEVDDLVEATTKYRNRSHFAQTAMENLLAEEARAGGA